MRFLESKIAFAATSTLFALAIAWNISQGSTLITGHLQVRTQVETVAHGPMLPPDPCSGTGTGCVVPGQLLPSQRRSDSIA